MKSRLGELKDMINLSYVMLGRETDNCPVRQCARLRQIRPTTIGSMRRVVDITLIAGFLLVDLFFFHDVFKPGESTSLAQWMTGFLSIGVFATCVQSLLKSTR